MRFCTPHLDAIKQAVRDRGLGNLMSESGEQAANKWRRIVEEGITIDTYEPQVIAENRIIVYAVDTFGQRALYIEGCPLCYINANNPDGVNYDRLVEHAAEDVLNMWKGLRP